MVFHSNIYICWLLIFFGYYTYKGITEYKRNTRQDKYGWTFNKNRLIFGIPEIPANWYISSRWNTGIYWSSKKDDTIGHVTKYISIDSFYKDKFEVDDYNLKPVKDVSRSLSIHTYYAQRKILDTDSVVYNYNEFNADLNKTHKISKQQADSILTAENVEKDY